MLWQEGVFLGKNLLVAGGSEIEITGVLRDEGFEQPVPFVGETFAVSFLRLRPALGGGSATTESTPRKRVRRTRK